VSKKHSIVQAHIIPSHPDKIKLAENQTREDADARFVELTKAYKA
jgi:preprotein translocase subunit Sec63